MQIIHDETSETNKSNKYKYQYDYKKETQFRNAEHSQYSYEHATI